MSSLGSPRHLDAAGEDLWPDEELLEAAARSEDQRQREEEVARPKRPFWAAEILLERISNMIDLRKEAKMWARNIWQETLNRVTTEIMVREIMKNFIDETIDRYETEVRRKETEKKAVDDMKNMLGGKTSNKKKREDSLQHENEPLEKKIVESKTGWKKIWEGGPTPTKVK